MAQIPADDYAQGAKEKKKPAQGQTGGLANQDITKPAPIDQPDNEKKQPEPAGLVNRNIAKPGLAE